ncbi:hypothetical protein AVEN_93661-1 [Araneus ventricosus]|uniref:Uncharacterized protein n=1 Tax=Araneus ventricosus TaxID=182803 RepID=A0A4Y2J853_ARAVE|nr:hypothetical protein AVEN_93661-1 [Araneus ventricosus]
MIRVVRGRFKAIEIVDLTIRKKVRRPNNILLFGYRWRWLRKRLAQLLPNAGEGLMLGGSSVESGFEPGTLWPQSRDLTTRSPWPSNSGRSKMKK